MEDILIGVTDRTILVFIPDPSSTTGVGKTGLAAAAVTVTYTRVETDNDVVHSDVTISMNDLANLTAAHNDWGWFEVSATLSKGLYRLDLADAVFASGAWYAVVQVTITSGTAAATPKAFRLVARNDLDGVRLGLTALPNAAADAAGGLPISDAGGLDLDAQLVTKINDILTDTGTTLDGRIPAALAADGSIKSSVQSFLGTAFTEGSAGDIAAAFKKVYNVVAATFTALSVNQTGDSYSALTGAQAEPGQGAPAVNASPLSKLAYLYKGWRNKKTQTATTFSLFADDAATVDQKATTSDDATTATVGEIATGP